MDRHCKASSEKLAPEPSLKRLPVYLQFLNRIKGEGVTGISAPKISVELGYDATQIVKDLSFTGIKGRPKIGYRVNDLIKAIEEYLCLDKNNEALLVGVGKLGQAILSYHELQGYGIQIIAAFDVDKDKVDTMYRQIPILHTNKLGELANRLGAKIGILTVPGEAAQEAAEAMVNSGINAIWNLTPTNLHLPDHVIVQDTSMYSNVAILLKKHHCANPE